MMPQATDELRAEMKHLFGDPINDAGPIKFLEDRGYKLTKQWTWLPKPGVKFPADMDNDEWMSLLFLIQEWDFGGLEYINNVT